MFRPPPEDVRNAATRIRLAINSGTDTLLVRQWLAGQFGLRVAIPADPYAAAEWVMCCHAHHNSRSRYRSTSRRDLARNPV